MFDINSLSEEERGLLEEVAKAKNQSIEEALKDLGWVKPPPPEQDEEVSLTAEEPVVVEEIATPSQPEAQVESELEEEAAEAELPPVAEEEVKEDESVEITGDLATASNICSLCGWDQALPVIGEPEHKDKLGFLQSVLGQKVFTKRYSIFGGNLKVTFRTLTIKEIDTLYEAAFKAQKLGVIATTADYYEYLNRLRLYLQLTGLSAKTTKLHVRLPEGLTKETHPDVNLYWDTFLKDKGLYKDKPLLCNQVADYVVKEVLKTEQLQRTITHECNNFNRLVAKLEACVDNQDFWKETEQPS